MLSHLEAGGLRLDLSEWMFRRDEEEREREFREKPRGKEGDLKKGTRQMLTLRASVGEAETGA